MKTRHSLRTGISGVTGVGLSLLLVGCTMEPTSTADERPRQRFEVTPGVTPNRADRSASGSRRGRPQSQVEVARADGAAEDGSAEEAPPAAPPAKSPEAVRKLVQAHAGAMRSAKSSQPPQPATPAADDGTVHWNNPDGADAQAAAEQPEAASSARPGKVTAAQAARRRPAAKEAVRENREKDVEAPLAPEAGPNTGAEFDPSPSVANVPTQIAPKPAPAAPAAPPAAPPPAPPATPPPSRPAPQAPEFGSPLAALDSSASTDPDLLFHKSVQRMRDYPTDPSAHLDYQMLRMLRDEQAPSVPDMGRLSAEDREMLTALMDGMSYFRNGLRTDKNMLPSQKIKALLDMADRLRSTAELTIPTIAACSKVQGFGVYDPMSSNLKAGIDNPLILYCEVQNFSSQQNDKGMWETKLSQEAVLYTESGLGVWKDKSDIPVDLSRNRRHDFFVVKKITLPRALGVGRYILKVTVVDEQVKRVAENSIPLQLLAQ